MNDHTLFDGPTPRGCLPSYPCPITPARPRAQDKLPEWDKEKADNPQYLMDMAKKFAVLSVLKAKGGECTFAEIYAKAEELHCDVVTAALNSMKRKKILSYDKEMGLLHPNDDAGATQPTHVNALLASAGEPTALPPAPQW